VGGKTKKGRIYGAGSEARNILNNSGMTSSEFLMNPEVAKRDKVIEQLQSLVKSHEEEIKIIKEQLVKSHEEELKIIKEQLAAISKPPTNDEAEHSESDDEK